MLNSIIFRHMLWMTLFALSVPVTQAADVEAGKNKAAMCVGCHGKEGQSNNPMFPRLAGQTSAYLANQLKAFQSGERSGAVMKNMVASLSADDIDNLAAYFAGITAKSAGGDAELAKTGKDKAAMCMGCHGAKGVGRGQFPRLAGQHPQYLFKQLRAFQTGERKGGPMAAITKNLSEQDMKEISSYFGSL